MRAMCAKPASPLGEKHIFENQSVKLGKESGAREFVFRKGVCDFTGRFIGTLTMCLRSQTVQNRSDIMCLKP